MRTEACSRSLSSVLRLFGLRFVFVFAFLLLCSTFSCFLVTLCLYLLIFSSLLFICSSYYCLVSFAQLVLHVVGRAVLLQEVLFAAVQLVGLLCMYVCIYIYIYICVHIYIYIYLCISMYPYIYIYTLIILY